MDTRQKVRGHFWLKGIDLLHCYWWYFCLQLLSLLLEKKHSIKNSLICVWYKWVPKFNIDCIIFINLNQSFSEVKCTLCGDKKEKHTGTLICICRSVVFFRNLYFSTQIQTHCPVWIIFIHNIAELHGLSQCSVLKGHSFCNLMDFCNAMVYWTTVQLFFHTFHQL